MTIRDVRVILCGVCLLCATNAAAQPPRSPDEPTRFQLGVGLLGAGAVGDFGTGEDGGFREFQCARGGQLRSSSPVYSLVASGALSSSAC